MALLAKCDVEGCETTAEFAEGSNLPRGWAQLQLWLPTEDPAVNGFRTVLDTVGDSLRAEGRDSIADAVASIGSTVTGNSLPIVFAPATAMICGGHKLPPVKVHRPSYLPRC